MDSSGELKPCPFCGNPGKIQIVREIVCGWPYDDSVWYNCRAYAQCGNINSCCYRSEGFQCQDVNGEPETDTENERVAIRKAADRWNTRADN